MFDEKQYRTQGFVLLQRLWPDVLLQGLADTAVGVCRMQATKIGLKAGDWQALRETPSFTQDLDVLVSWLDAHDPDALDEATGIIIHTAAAKRLATYEPFLSAVSQALSGCPAESLIVDGPGILINLPGVTRRLYTWHSEAHWYPKRRNFLNTWSPLIRSKTSDNGTMQVAAGSQQKQWSFSEYYGFNATTQGDRRHFLQYEVPDVEVAGLERVTLRADPGDSVFFDRNTLHRSSVNASALPSYIFAMRAYDYRRDLTIGANWGERPYREMVPSRPGGRSGLVPVE